MLYKIIGFVAHRSIRIANNINPVLLLRKAGQEVDLSIEKHLVQITELTVYILILPACVFQKLLVILIGVAGLDLTFLRSLLKDFVLVISNADHPVV